MGLIRDVITGRARLERVRNRALTKLYEGGRITRDRTSASYQFSHPEDMTETRQRLQMIRESREMESNFPLVEMILDAWEIYGLGTIRYQPTTGDTLANQEISEWIKYWFESCDRLGRYDFSTIARLALRGKKRDGEAGVIDIDDRGDYKIQLVSGERIGNPTIVGFPTEFDQNGIIIDREGRPIEYEIYKRPPGQLMYQKDVVVPAAYFSHIYDAFLPEQYHGVTSLKSVITRLRDLKEVQDASRLNIKYRSQQLPYLKTETGENPFGANTGFDDTEVESPHVLGSEEGVSIQQIRNAEQMYLKTTEGVFDFPHDFPNGQFLPWVETCIKEIMAGAGIAYEFTWGIKELQGTVGRLVVERQDRVMQFERKKMEDQFMRRTVRRAIRAGYECGAISRNVVKRYEGIFFYGPRISADYGRDAKADIDLIKMGLLTETEYQHIHGRNPEDTRSIRLQETLDLIEDGKQVAEAAGMAESNAVNLIRATYQNPPQTQSVSESKSLTVDPTLQEIEEETVELSEGFKPTAAMAQAAQRALNRRAELPESKRGMTATGIARARDISNRRNLSEETVRAMSAWFARHEETSRNSPNYDQRERAWIAWNGWGGDSGRTWADRIVERLDKIEEA